MPTGRRSLMRSLPPLWLIGVCLFLPTVRACERMESPASLFWGGKLYFGALLAPYFVAQLLCVLTIVALARGHVSKLITRATATVVILSGASAALLAVIGIERPTHLDEQLWSVFAGACFAAAAAVLWRARRLEPWTRLACFHAAYTIFTLPMAALLLRIVVGDGWHKVGYGAPLFLAAFLVLAFVHARTLARARSAMASSTA